MQIRAYSGAALSKVSIIKIITTIYRLEQMVTSQVESNLDVLNQWMHMLVLMGRHNN